MREDGISQVFETYCKLALVLSDGIISYCEKQVKPEQRRWDEEA